MRSFAQYRIIAIIVMKIKFYRKNSGKQPVITFLDKLPAEESARIVACLQNVEKLGFDSPRVSFRQIRGSLWEIKIKTHRSGYRLFYVCLRGEHMVLLHAYKKQSQKAPKKEIELAEKRLLEVKEDESTYID